MVKRFVLAAVLSFFVAIQPMQAWFDGGHMICAYVAYRNLTPQTRARVDQLLKLNKMYASWTEGTSEKRKALVAFLHAATWPDCIKQPACAAGYISDGGNVPPGSPTDSQNIGYDDMLMHKYWHFVDAPYSAGAPGDPAKRPNAETEIALLTQAIRTDESDGIKSYDVVWLEHLVGDVHQPLHCTSRFTKNYPHGDAGGNFVHFCEDPCRDELHAYWDGLLGDRPPVSEVIETGDRLLASGKPKGADNADPNLWIADSFELAKEVVYAPPISDENDLSTAISPRPDAAYQTKAFAVAQSQIRLAGYRLAALLNNNLK